MRTRLAYLNRQGEILSALAVVSDMSLPVTVEGVTAQWLTSALAFRFAGVEVTSCNHLAVLPGTSTKVRVALEYNDVGREMALPSRMIVKGGFQDHSESMKDMYRNEMRFYRDVLPFINMNAPNCFYAGADPDRWQSVVVMEDLEQREACFCRAQQSQRYEEVERRLSAMARYHAQTWNSAEFEMGGRFDWVGERFSDWSLEYQNRYLEPDVWAHYVSLPRGAAVSRYLHDREWMVAALADIASQHKGKPVCLIHGDTHLGNLFVEPDGTPGFFDAQVSRAPWSLEVAYHIGCALDIEDRRAWERPLLEHYLSQLATGGVEAPSFDEAWEDYRRDLAYGYFIFAINETRFQTEAVNTAYAARFGAALVDHARVGSGNRKGQ
ncbi:phosphotransferase [Paraburkholderia sp. BR10882]|uniref:phosphotransferase n=1 Tax=unclassified Paraburkholderia TaxID=2615204 RepID=UPI0034CE0C08